MHTLRLTSTLCALSLFVVTAPTANADTLTLGTTERLSANADDASQAPIVPLNGKFVSFSSLSAPAALETNPSDLLSPLQGTLPSPRRSNIFTTSLSGGIVTLLSYKWYYRCLTFGGNRSCSYQRVYADDESILPAISPVSPENNYTVAFQSSASNFLADSINSRPNRTPQIYLYDPNWLYPQDRIKAVSSRSDTPCGKPTDDLSASLGNGPSSAPSLALFRKADGSGVGEAHVVYATDATNLVDGDNNGHSDVLLTTVPYLEDSVPSPRPTPDPASATLARCFSFIEHTRISVRSDGVESNGASDQPKISGSTQYVVYRSTAGNLDERRPAGTSFGVAQVYLFDSATSTSRLVSTAADGTPGNGASHDPAVSFQGSKVAYLTSAVNIAPAAAAPAGVDRVVVFDAKTGRSSQANVAKNGTPSNGTATSAMLSPDGRFVVFADTGSNLVANDTNSLADIFIKNLEDGSIQRVTNGLNGQGADGESFTPVITFDGFNGQSGFVTYSSAAHNLAAGDSSQGRMDIYRTFFSLQVDTLTKNKGIEVPPDALVSGSDVVITAKQFSAARATKRNALTAAATRATIKYEMSVQKDGGTVRKIISKRNSLTLSKLSPGTYSVSYRAVRQQGKATPTRTKFSPAQRLKIS